MPMNIAQAAVAAGWKHDNASGIRFFQSSDRAKKLGYEPVQVGDFFVIWPEKLGKAPTLEQLEAWHVEYEAAQQTLKAQQAEEDPKVLAQKIRELTAQLAQLRGE